MLTTQILAYRGAREPSPDIDSADRACGETLWHVNVMIIERSGAVTPMNQPLPMPQQCVNCSTVSVGQFCPNCGSAFNRGAPARCWNCGEAVQGNFCGSCGVDVSKRPLQIVDEDSAAVKGAVQTGLLWGIFSRPENRVKNALLGAAIGGINEQSAARAVNELFAAGASVAAISTYRKRTVALGLTTITVGVAYLTLLGLAAQSLPQAVVAAIFTWLLLKLRARVVRWTDQPLERESIIRARFGSWQRGTAAEANFRRARRFRRLAVVAIAFQILVAVSSQG